MYNVYIMQIELHLTNIISCDSLNFHFDINYQYFRIIFKRPLIIINSNTLFYHTDLDWCVFNSFDLDLNQIVIWIPFACHTFVLGVNMLKIGLHYCASNIIRGINLFAPNDVLLQKNVISITVVQLCTTVVYSLSMCI